MTYSDADDDAPISDASFKPTLHLLVKLGSLTVASLCLMMLLFWGVSAQKLEALRFSQVSEKVSTKVPGSAKFDNIASPNKRGMVVPSKGEKRILWQKKPSG